MSILNKEDRHTTHPVARLQAILKKEWNINTTLTPLGKGSTAFTWVADDFVIKVVSDTPEHFNIGLRVSQILETKGIPTGIPVPTKAGRLSVSLSPGNKSRLVAVLRKANGSPLSMHAVPPSILGALLGKIHHILQGTETEGAWTVTDVLGYMRRGVLASQPDEVQHMIAQAIDDVDAWYREASPALQLIRGDGPEILSVDGKEISSIIDWGGVRLGNVADDIGCWTVHGATDKITLREYTADFLQAYKTANNLTKVEEDAIPLFQRLRIASRACYIIDPAALALVQQWMQHMR